LIHSVVEQSGDVVVVRPRLLTLLGEKKSFSFPLVPPALQPAERILGDRDDLVAASLRPPVLRADELADALLQIGRNAEFPISMSRGLSFGLNGRMVTELPLLEGAVAGC
jgi:hypothetical protein